MARLESPLAAQPIPVAFALADADAKGRGGALWAAVVRSGADEAGAADTPPPRCTARAAGQALQKLEGREVLVALDLARPAGRPAAAALVGVWPLPP